MFLINGINIEEYGLYFASGTMYRELLKLPKPKPRLSNEFPDMDGKDYDDVTPTYYESLTYNPTCYLVADDIEDLMTKRQQLLLIFENPQGFLLTSSRLATNYRLHYMDSPSLRTLTPIWREGKLYVEFSLTLENNFRTVERHPFEFATVDTYAEMIELTNSTGGKIVLVKNDEARRAKDTVYTFFPDGTLVWNAAINTKEL